jgi:hypothetical protein
MSFEVASIRLGDPGKFIRPTIDLSIEDTPITPGGAFIADFSLPIYIQFAYKILLTREQQQAMVAHLPKWVVGQPFVIQAKAPMADVTKDQMRLMMHRSLPTASNWPCILKRRISQRWRSSSPSPAPQDRVFARTHKVSPATPSGLPHLIALRLPFFPASS